MAGTDHFPTRDDLDEIGADPQREHVAALIEWCRNLLADREEAIWWARLSRTEREGMWARIRAGS